MSAVIALISMQSDAQGAARKTLTFYDAKNV